MNTEKKLSKKQRKKLPDKVFCGPKRSFPANDCKHVKAGLSLLGRYKGPGSKEKIRACLYRRARKLNCFKSGPGSKKKDSYAPALNEIYVMYRDGMIADEDVFAELSRYCDMASLSAGQTAQVLSPFVIEKDLFAAIVTFDTCIQEDE